MNLLHFTETPRFTKRASKLIDDDEMGGLQWYLNSRPEVGSVIRNSGGMRKMRWSSSGHGKRGGSRIIYYFALAHDKILLLDIYAKNEKADLSRAEIAYLKTELDSWLKRI